MPDIDVLKSDRRSKRKLSVHFEITSPKSKNPNLNGETQKVNFEKNILPKKNLNLDLSALTQNQVFSPKAENAYQN